MTSILILSEKKIIQFSMNFNFQTYLIDDIKNDIYELQFARNYQSIKLR